MEEASLHEFTENYPLTDELVCIRCGLKTKVGQFHLEKCIPKEDDAKS